MQKLLVSTILIVLLLVGRFPIDIALGADRSRPFRIGALTESWGPTPPIVGLRDGLVELGYRENQDFGVHYSTVSRALRQAEHDMTGIHDR